VSDSQDKIYRTNPDMLQSVLTSLLIDIEDSLDLGQRGNLIELDRHLHELWALGKNFVVGWSPQESGVLLLVVPHYAVADYVVTTDTLPSDITVTDSDPHAFIMRMLSGSRKYSERQLQNAGRLLNADPIHLKLRQPLQGSETEFQIINRLIQRYSVNFVSSRAVALFDIVGFSLLSPFEQMTQLNSLSHSLNSAHSKMLGNQININFARSSTGDGFYLWNRDIGIEANTNLYHLMHLVLADNAIARRKAHGRTVPLLRTGFHVGGCYEFYQAEGLNPTVYSDIIGDVTIELARMIDGALPGQILVGEFNAIVADADPRASGQLCMNSAEFVAEAQKNLSQLSGLELSGDAIDSIKCYLTGQPLADGTFTVRTLTIDDKHGLSRNVYNAKVNIYRSTGDPILLGIEDRLLGDAEPEHPSPVPETRKEPAD
jgi:hypothetical protein